MSRSLDMSPISISDSFWRLGCHLRTLILGMTTSLFQRFTKSWHAHVSLALHLVFSLKLYMEPLKLVRAFNMLPVCFLNHAIQFVFFQLKMASALAETS